MQLTEKKVRDLRAAEKVQVVCDGEGLYLEVLHTGRKVFFYRVRKKDIATGKMVAKRVTIGSYPETSLYAARMERDKLKAEGVSPIVGDASTFKQLANEWLERKCKPTVTEKHALKQQGRLERVIIPALGLKRPADITPQDVLKIIRDLEGRGLKEVPSDIKQLIGQILRYGIAIGVCQHDVTADLRGAVTTYKETHRATLHDPQQIGGLMRAINELPPTSVKRLLLFTAYTFARPSEARLATWSEIDIDRKEWRLSSERMKMRRPHIVPLSRQALEIIEEARMYGADASPYIFPALRLKQNPLSDMACLAALRRIGFSREEMSVHGFRSIASTSLYEAGFNGTAIERQLAHADSNEVRAAYNYAEFLELRRQMMQWYADYLDSLRDMLQITDHVI